MGHVAMGHPKNLGLPQIVEDAVHHPRSEGTLAGGVAQLLEFLGEVMVKKYPTLQFPPGGIWGKFGAVLLRKFCASV